ncbi:MAG: VWA domain-containing protein [Planctomycetes bacterium]|nr:VWA domain-containing protein [Planctomycetota bacterium]
MSRLLLPLLALLLAPLVLARPAALAVDEYQDAVSAFHKASASGSLGDRKQALERLMSLGEPAALGLLSGELGRVSTRLREATDEAYRLRYAAERKQAFIEELKLRAEKDHTLEKSLSDQRQKLRDLEAQLGKERDTIAAYTPWHEALGEGTATFSASLADSKRKGVEKELWKEIAESSDLGAKLAAVEILGYLGGPGTAVDLQKLIGDLVKERSSLERKLPKLMTEVRKLEKRMQEENVQTGGRSSMGPQYDAAKKEAADVQAAVTKLAHICDAASEAGGVALAREEGELLDKSVKKLLAAQKKAKDGARRRTLNMLGKSGVPSVLAELRTLAAAEKEAAGRAYLIDALAEAGDGECAELLLGTLFDDESWFVRSRAYAAAARLRLKAAIPRLIDRLEAEQGRLRGDANDALRSLTGQNYRNNATLWRRWWGENGESFEVPPIGEIEQKASEEAKEAIGTTFFGISTESKRVLFVLDLSGSMEFAMIPRDNPDDDPNKPRDEPRAGERSRLEEARIALNKAIGGTQDGAVFNVVFYASDVWTWQDDLVEMNAETRGEALAMIEELQAVGGTNIYSALAIALEMAGAKGGDSWSAPEIDTIFFLTDGRPSVGLTTDPDEILAFVRDLNASAGITIHTIGLSGAQDAYLLRSLAEQNGGEYVAR